MDITIIVGIAGILIICLFCTPVIIFAGTTHSRHLKKMKNQTEVQGRVIKREYVEAPIRISSSYSYYQVTYDFEDRYGNHFVKRFDTVPCPFEEGDNILVYYDAANPNNCVTAHQVKISKDAPRKTFFSMLIIVMLSIVGYLFAIWVKGY